VIADFRQFSPLFLALLLVKLALFLSCFALVLLVVLKLVGLAEAEAVLRGGNAPWLVLVLFAANAAVQIVWRVSGKPIKRSDPK
jgi:uncharacterized membrane protein YqjE